MSNNDDYLCEVLRTQEVRPGSAEMKELEQARKDIETLLRRNFEDCSPTIRYGGSKMKGTMNLEDYDLDVICYFPRDDTRAGKTIKEIYENVCVVLEKEYEVTRGTTALRIKDTGQDLKVDVVPGRFIDEKQKYAFVHQNGGTKVYLQTNLDQHIEYVRDSGCTSEIRLMKLWRPCAGIDVRTFPLELVAIEILNGTGVSDLGKRLRSVLMQIRDNIDSIQIADPASRGNDLNDLLNASTRQSMAIAAASTLAAAERFGWEQVFRRVMGASNTERAEALRVSIIRNEPRTPPWRKY